MASIDDIGTPGQPMSVKPLTAWQAAVRDALNGLRNIPQLTVSGRGASGGIGGLTPSVLRKDFSLADASMVGNLLTPNVASGTDYLGTTEGFFAYGPLTREPSASGYAIRAGSPGGFPQLHFGTNRAEGDALLPVVAGLPLTLFASVKSSNGSASIIGQVAYFDGAGVGVGGDGALVSGGGHASEKATSVTFAAVPAGAKFCRALMYQEAAGADQWIQLDRLGLWQGAGGEWAMPGTPITGLGTRITRPNIDDRLVEVWNPNKAGGAGWSVVDYDSGWRDVSGSLINGWTGALAVQRTLNHVLLRVYNLAGPPDTNAFVLPVGFRSVAFDEGMFLSMSRLDLTPGGVWMNRGANGGIEPRGSLIGYAGLNLPVSFPAENTIPTSLPGTLVTPAPQ